MSAEGVGSYRFGLRIAFAVIGSVVGYSVLLCFASVYHNYNTAGWAGLSGLLATSAGVLHWQGRKQALYSTSKLHLVSWIGLAFFVLGIGGIVGYITAAAVKHQKLEAHGNGYYLTSIWCFMTAKWGGLLWFYARMYSRSVNQVPEKEKLLN